MGLTQAIDTPCENSKPRFMIIGSGETHRVIPIEAAKHEPREATVSKTIGGRRRHFCLECIRAGAFKKAEGR